MKKLDSQTPELTEANIDKIAVLFPQVVTEKEAQDGTLTRSVDFDLLRQELSGSVVEGGDERYRLDWPGKRASLLKANTPIKKTLRPVREESVDFDTTQNLFIEGDNFEALKILQESYLGKVKMIYIDPPYNTGKDFVYKDNFTKNKADYEEEIGAVDEEGNKMFRENTRTNPRFHSDWLSMMYERLIIARDLLSEDGVIFISIDDNEVHNLRKICDEIFGENNFIQNFMWLHGKGKKDKHSRTLQQYILCYAKSKEELPEWSILKNKNYDFQNPDNDPDGPWFSGSVSFSEERSNQDHSNYYTITSPSGVVWQRQWQCSEDQMHEYIKNNRIYWGLGPDYSKVPRLKIRPGDKEEVIPENIIDNVGTTKSAEKEIRALFGADVFSYPKPKRLISHLVALTTQDNDLIVDFFAGSATTFHSVLSQNSEDGGSRKTIIVQLPEELDLALAGDVIEKKKIENAIEYLSRAGKPLNVAELARERMRLSVSEVKKNHAEKIKERHAENDFDTGFRTYRVDDTAFLDVERQPTHLGQGELLALANNLRSDRTSEDLLTQVMLELGLTLDLPIEEKEISGHKIFFVAQNALVACLDGKVPLTLIDEMVKCSPLQVVFRDSSFGSDQDRINAETHIKRLSPDTELLVL